MATQKIEKGTPEQRAEIQRRLRKKYPQMFTGSYPSAQQKQGFGKKVLNAITSQLKRAGLTDKEIAKLRGKKK